MKDICHFSLLHQWKRCMLSVTLSKICVKPSSQPASQARSCCVLCSIHSVRAPAPSIQPAIQTLSVWVPAPVSHSTTQLLSPTQTSFSCPRMQCSDVPANAVRLSLFWCVFALKRLQGNSLPGAGSCCFLQLAAVWGENSRMPWGRSGSAVLLLLSGRATGRAKAR